MDPRHVQDFNSLRQYGYEQLPPMSPEFGIELVNALNAPKGKGKINFHLISVRLTIYFQNTIKKVLNYLQSVARRLRNGLLMERILNNNHQQQLHLLALNLFQHFRKLVPNLFRIT